MKGLPVIFVVGAIALIAMANGASADSNSQHRTGIQFHVREMPRTFANTYGYAPRQAPQNQSQEYRYQHMYESDSLGHQWFANPDRVLPAPAHDY